MTNEDFDLTITSDQLLVGLVMQKETSNVVNLVTVRFAEDSGTWTIVPSNDSNDRTIQYCG